MARPREKPEQQTKEAQLAKRAASRGYTIEQEDGQWYAAIGGTRYGPMTSLDELDELLPKE